MSYANNKGAELRSLISAFVVRCPDSVMSLVSVTKISSLMLASAAEQAGLSLTWSETFPEDTFSHHETQMKLRALRICIPQIEMVKHQLVSKQKSGIFQKRTKGNNSLCSSYKIQREFRLTSKICLISVRTW